MSKALSSIWLKYFLTRLIAWYAFLALLIDLLTWSLHDSFESNLKIYQTNSLKYRWEKCILYFRSIGGQEPIHSAPARSYPNRVFHRSSFAPLIVKTLFMLQKLDLKRLCTYNFLGKMMPLNFNHLAICLDGDRACFRKAVNFSGPVQDSFSVLAYAHGF